MSNQNYWICPRCGATKDFDPQAGSITTTNISSDVSTMYVHVECQERKAKDKHIEDLTSLVKDVE